jgi:hypothetical protein
MLFSERKKMEIAVTELGNVPDCREKKRKMSSQMEKS